MLNEKTAVDGMNGKENQRVALTKRLLLEALFELLRKKHINEIGVTELCAAAEINRATFYKHYSTPNDILEEFGRKYTAELLRIQNESKKTKTPVQTAEACFEFMYAGRERICLLIKNGVDGEMGMKALEGILEQMELSEMISLDCVDETEKKLLLSYISSGCYSLFRTWLMEDLPKSPKEIATLIYRMATKGWI